MIVPKYKIGEELYAVKVRKSEIRERKLVHLICEKCNGTGSVYDDKCDYCSGRGEYNTYEYNHGPFNYEVVLHGNVCSIYTRVYSDDMVAQGYENNITYQFITEKPKKRSAIFKEDRVFKTLEEALDFCEKYVAPNSWDGENPILRSNEMKCRFEV